MKLYQIIGLGPALDGRLVEIDGDDVVGYVPVVSISGHPLTPQGLCVHADHLKAAVDPGELATDNPYGKWIQEIKWHLQNITVAYSQYERCQQVNIQEEIPRSEKEGGPRVKTIYSENFWGTIAPVRRLLQENNDIDDLVFALKDLKKKQSEDAQNGSV